MVTLEGYAEDWIMRKVTVSEAYPYTFRPLRPPVVRGGRVILTYSMVDPLTKINIDVA